MAVTSVDHLAYLIHPAHDAELVRIRELIREHDAAVRIAGLREGYEKGLKKAAQLVARTERTFDYPASAAKRLHGLIIALILADEVEGRK